MVTLQLGPALPGRWVARRLLARFLSAIACDYCQAMHSRVSCPHRRYARLDVIANGYCGDCWDTSRRIVRHR